MELESQQRWRLFFVRIILPSVFAISLFIISIFQIIIPAFEDGMLESRKETVKELTNSAWSIIAKIEQEEREGVLSRDEAQQRAVFALQALRYGDEVKDYFWVTDMHPRMIMHPYRPDLTGLDLTEFRDVNGKQLFCEFVEIAKTKNAGYVRYMWETTDGSGRVVPKISYVRFFEPWNWVIGTGIYLEVVEKEIKSLTSRLINISIIIIAVIAVLLIYITRESIKIEADRQKKERGLQESREKYRTLVEAANEGIIMSFGTQFIYSNKTMQRMLGYTKDELSASEYSLFFDHGNGENPGFYTFQAVMNGERATPLQYESRLKTREGEVLDVALTSSRIDIAGREGFITIVRDISSHKKIEGELGASIEKYELLTHNISVGVFRTKMGGAGRFIEANPAAVSIFGKQDVGELFRTRVTDLFHNQLEGKEFVCELVKERVVKHIELEIISETGPPRIISLSANLVDDENGEPLYCDGLVEDITDIKKAETERENLIVELQAALLFMNQPIQINKESLPTCSIDSLVIDAVKKMTDSDASAILVYDSVEDDYTGILTDYDIRGGLADESEHYQGMPVSELMSSPVISVPEQSLMFEALLVMLEENVTHLAVRNNRGDIAGVINDLEVLRSLKYPLAMLLRDVYVAKTPEQIFEIRKRLPRLVRALIDSGADIRHLSRLVSAVSEAIMKKLISFATDEMGRPPVKFTFMALGSVGRQEQSLATDQDNAIVYEDVDPEKEEEVKKYFLAFGTRVCGWLDEAGYTFCDGDIMAKNPKWCQPVSVWKQYFRSWVNSMEPDAILDSSIFFDFRGVAGDLTLTGELYDELNRLMATKPLFFYYLAQNCLRFKPPLGFFKNIVLESSGKNKNTFSIKKAMTPIVDFARLYALKNQINDQSTLGRLKQLNANGHITDDLFKEIQLTYKYLMGLRFEHQAYMMARGKMPDNQLNPKRLAAIEKTMLKESLIQVSNLQNKISMEYKSG